MSFLSDTLNKETMGSPISPSWTPKSMSVGARMNLITDTGRSGSALRNYLRSPIHKSGMEWGVKWNLGIGQKGIAKWLGRGFLGVAAYQGYQEGGVGGAITGAGKQMAYDYVAGAAVRAAISNPMISKVSWPIIGTLLGLGTMAAGLYKLGGGSLTKLAARPWVKEHMKKHSALEMSTPVIDDYGTVATMRQRSVNAIQNSRLNGRSALNNEASLMYNPYY